MTHLWRDRAMVLSPVLAIGLLAAMPPGQGPTTCPFALVTGMACPGCGMTRALGFLVRGDIVSAMRYHPLAPLVLAAAIGGWFWYLLRRAGRVLPIPPRIVSTMLISAAVLLVAVWFYRWGSGSLPPV
jgi:Protein of unknown function (DUF2752)